MNTQIRKLAVFSLFAMLVFTAGTDSTRADDTDV